LPEAQDGEVTQRLDLPKDISIESTERLMPIKEVEDKQPSKIEEPKSPEGEAKDPLKTMS
jgi:hypothetical protein